MNNYTTFYLTKLVFFVSNQLILKFLSTSDYLRRNGCRCWKKQDNVSNFNYKRKFQLKVRSLRNIMTKKRIHFMTQVKRKISAWE